MKKSALKRGATFVFVILAELSIVSPVQSGIRDIHTQAMAEYRVTHNYSQAITTLEKGGIDSLVRGIPSTLQKRLYVQILNDYAFLLAETRERFREAIPILETVIDLDPGRYVAYLNLGDAFKKAVDEATECRELDTYRARVYEAYRKYKDAIDDKRPDFPIPHRVLRIVHADEYSDDPLPPKRPIKCEFQLVMSKSNDVCQYALGALNKEIASGDRFHGANYTDSAFSSITWTRIDRERGYSNEVALFDVNNDGRSDYVLRQTHTTGKGVQSQALFFFDPTPPFDARISYQEAEKHSFGMITIEDGYDFKDIPPERILAPTVMSDKGGIWAPEFHPFAIGGVTYLLAKSSMLPDPDWVLIAKYRRGKVTEENPTLMEDICYLQ